MSVDTFVTIVGLALLVISQIAMWHAGKNVYLKYKDQRVGVRTKWWRR